MDAARWKQIDQLLSAALDLDSDKRAAFLDEACVGDDALRTEIESLLVADKKEQNRLEDYPKQMAADLISARRTLPGNSIGPYKILSMIGSGGMGEVYRASDSRIGREVAVKILPSLYSQDSDRLRRFEQEAHAAGMINHPNIVAIFDTGTNNGSPYLVSELLQGEVLQQKLRGQPLPVRKATDYALQIANGLSAAHEKGIVHRDLKPGNIFITKEGRIKILDFGLAKLTHPELITSSESTELTETGVVLGTVVYMSPEQVSGRKVDHRSDIFAFGSVLYEMFSGKRPFGGDTQIEIMHAILKADPPELSQSNGNIPLSIERIIRRCLEKDPEHRFQSASDLAFALESLSATSGTAVVPPAESKSIPFAWIVSGFLFLVAAILGLALYRQLSRTVSENASVQRLSVVLPANTILNSLAVSPDAHRLAYVTNGPTGFSKLWLRSMDSPKAEEVPGTFNAGQPFWSPDGRSIGFFTERELKKVTIGGGPPEELADVAIPRGGTWNQYGDILFSPKSSEGIHWISAQGGEVKPATALDPSRQEVRHSFPQFLPDGRHFFYIVNSTDPEHAGVFIGSLDSKDRKKILDEMTPVRYVHPGYLFFVRDNRLVVQQFDTQRQSLTGDPMPLAHSNSNFSSGPIFDVANNLLIYGDRGEWPTQPIWFNREGKESGPGNYPIILGDPGYYSFCDLSADDKRLLMIRIESSPDAAESMWMVDLSSGAFQRYAMTNEKYAVFSPDGSQVAYSQVGSMVQPGNLYIRSSDGTGKSQQLNGPGAPLSLASLSWSADSRYLSFTVLDPKTNFDLWILPLEEDRKPFPYLATRAREETMVFSPDGKWVAYQSYQSGRAEIYVGSFPAEAGGVWAISTQGGEQPMWRRDGKELFYLTLDKKLMAMEVQTGEVFKPGDSRVLFQAHVKPRMIGSIGGGTKQYFPSSDGNYFLVNSMIDNKEPQEINVLVNWTSLLKKKTK